jgi:hypothetical protein
MTMEEILSALLGAGMFLVATKELYHSIMTRYPFPQYIINEEDMTIQTTVQAAVTEEFALAGLIMFVASDGTRVLEQMNTNKFHVVEPDGSGYVIEWRDDLEKFLLTYVFTPEKVESRPKVGDDKFVDRINQMNAAAWVAFKVRETTKLQLISCHTTEEGLRLSMQLAEPPTGIN